MIYFSEGGGEFKRTRAEMFHPPLAKIPPPWFFYREFGKLWQNHDQLGGWKVENVFKQDLNFYKKKIIII